MAEDTFGLFRLAAIDVGPCRALRRLTEIARTGHACVNLRDRGSGQNRAECSPTVGTGQICLPPVDAAHVCVSWIILLSVTQHSSNATKPLKAAMAVCPRCCESSECLRFQVLFKNRGHPRQRATRSCFVYRKELARERAPLLSGCSLLDFVGFLVSLRLEDRLWDARGPRERDDGPYLLQQLTQAPNLLPGRARGQSSRLSNSQQTVRTAIVASLLTHACCRRSA